MPRGRKRASADGSTTTGVSGIELPGGGTNSDISKLSKTLNLPKETISAIMSCNGQGVARRSERGSSSQDASAAGMMDPAMMNVWGDFMSEEMTSTSSAPSAPSSSAAAASSSTAAAGKSDESTTKPSSSGSAKKPEPSAEGPRSYVLPIQPRMYLGNGKKSSVNNNDNFPTPGLLAQTGTLDASV